VSRLTSDQINNCDVVLNLAGEPIADQRWTARQKSKICQSRWQITQRISTLIKQAENPPCLFISGSAIGFYGRQHNSVVDENFTSINQEFTHSICQQWEQIARQAESDITRVVFLRMGIVLAPKKQGGALAKMYLPFKLGLGAKIGTGEQVMSWVHLDDVVNAILYLVKNNDLNGAVNITAPTPVTNAEFSNSLASQLKRPCLFTTPVWLIKLLLGEMADLLVYGQKVMPAKLLDSGFVFQYKTVKSALANLIN
jgi:hypothetical protein